MKAPSGKVVAISGGAGMAGMVMTGVIQLYSMYLDSQEKVQVTRTAAFQKAEQAGDIKDRLLVCQDRLLQRRETLCGQ